MASTKHQLIDSCFSQPKHPDIEISPPEWTKDKVWRSQLSSDIVGRNVKTWDEELQREYRGVVSSRVGRKGHCYKIVYDHENEAPEVDLYEVPFILLGTGRARAQPVRYTEEGKFLPASTYLIPTVPSTKFSTVSTKKKARKGKRAKRKKATSTRTPHKKRSKAPPPDADATSTSPTKNRFINGAMHTTQAKRFSVGQQVVWNSEDDGETHLAQVTGFERNEEGFFTGKYKVQIRIGKTLLSGTALHRDLFVPANEQDDTKGVGTDDANEVETTDVAGSVETKDVGTGDTNESDSSDDDNSDSGDESKGKSEDESEGVSVSS